MRRDLADLRLREIGLDHLRFSLIALMYSCS